MIKKMFQKYVQPPMISHMGHHVRISEQVSFAQGAREGYQLNPIVYRCVHLIARGIASVPWLLYEGDKEISHHKILDLFTQPSKHQSGMAFFEALVSYLLIGGNAYILKTTDALYCVNPQEMKIERKKDGSIDAYVVGKVRYAVDGKTGLSDVLHLKLFNPMNPDYGMSPMQAASLSIDQHNTVSKHNLNLLENGGRPSGAFLVKSQTFLSDKQREALKSDLKKAYEGANNAGKVLFLEGDFEWQEMGQSLKDLDFIEGKYLSAREIAQCFGVPPMLVGVPGDATFANFKEARFHLWEDTLLPLLDYLVGEFNHWIVKPYGEKLWLTYDTDQIHALSVRRESSWAKIATVDFLTVNEKRQAVGYGPLPDGDRLGTVS